MKNKKGFTLIELLAVIVILGVIMVISLPNVVGVIERQKKDNYINDAKKLLIEAKRIVKSNTDIENPYDGGMVILTFGMIDSGDLSKDIEGNSYDENASFVLITGEGDTKTYWVQLMSDKGKGLSLTKERDLSKEETVNRVGQIGLNQVSSTRSKEHKELLSQAPCKIDDIEYRNSDDCVDRIISNNTQACNSIKGYINAIAANTVVNSKNGVTIKNYIYRKGILKNNCS